ncbi:energy transducer TonB [bacterium]|nr:energy transducer TonB [bacterium]
MRTGSTNSMRGVTLPSSGMGWGASFLAHACAGVLCYFMPGESTPAPDAPRATAPVEVNIAFVKPRPQLEPIEAPPPKFEAPSVELPEVTVPVRPLEFVKPEPTASEPRQPRVRECRRIQSLEAPPVFLTDVTPPEPPAPAPSPPRPPTPKPARVQKTKPSESPPPTPSQASAAVLSPVPDAKNPPPSYPRLARHRGYEGTVLLRIRVSAKGRCLTVEIVESSGYASLDHAAVEAVQAWEFEPARSDGIAVEAEVDAPFRFRLTE